jgi:D-alanine transaminase
VPEIAYVNGEFLPLEQAMIHVEDRGFQFADAVYEVLRTYRCQPFALDEHMARLFRSLDSIRLQHSFTADHLKSLITEAVLRAGFDESVIYLQITRGRAPRHRGIPSKSEPTLVITVRELHSMAHLRETGVSVITFPDNRWARCDIKSVALLANVLAYRAAREAGAYDAVFIEADGAVNESTAGNVFVVTGNKVSTPPKSPRILSGVTRDKILEAARAAGLEVREEPVAKETMLAADEVFLTSTTLEIIPVVAVDGREIGSGKPGPVTARVYDQFARMFTQK